MPKDEVFARNGTYRIMCQPATRLKQELDATMSLPPTYSRRKREAEGKSDDVYVYDRVPQNVRVQVVQILRVCGDGRYAEAGCRHQRKDPEELLGNSPCCH